MGRLNYFERNKDNNTTFDEARMSVITFRVVENLESGEQAVMLEGDYDDVAEALVNSDVIIVAISSDDDPIAEA
jgi:hypothetical protein